MSAEGKSAVLEIEHNDFFDWKAKFNVSLLTDEMLFLTDEISGRYYVPDSVIMVKYSPERWVLLAYEIINCKQNYMNKFKSYQEMLNK